ncbi:uncharacterized protein LOC113062470 isoform X2 [Carassius auratus]|uniref:Uncharacterized protein LOC113062470 isoform X2 n=1 Tax=Carassius auratus TaxID=7957 RepID=A0A6P6LXB7_CARAU|nr:uncharacterized protein LOC113062470 isoform X2 [Carassius auratus]XP_026088136.1 uncharacterized protein LOC113062470 isoform X2 [Carassius auratus]
MFTGEQLRNAGASNKHAQTSNDVQLKPTGNSNILELTVGVSSITGGGVHACDLVPVDLLAMPSGQDALSCCRRDFTNDSSSYELSERPDPTSHQHWSADDIVVVDETGGVDESRVHYKGPQSLILRGKHTHVIFQMDFASLKHSEEIICKDLCLSPDEFSPTPGQSLHTRRPDNAANRSTSDGIFIFLSIFLSIFVT